MDAPMDADLRTSETIFHEARLRPAGAERDAYLDGACAGDASLRERVGALLRADDDAGRFLEPTTVNQSPGGLERAGTRIGRYKLLQLIGEGGMGAVYMAEQTDPVRRKVALKIIKLGMDTKQVIARFEAERQALAMMDHPNIARVLDAGATETGRPYFAMELVKGVPITEYCDVNKLGTPERLELLIAVCRGVQHAHQKGVIHRDLKPQNVLVTLHDGTPVPKIIDFGIAKAVSARLTDKTLFTEYRQFVGTPQYMSPEQAEMSGLDVDTRTDIYSLGVMLHELLTGETPFTKEELRTGLAEVQKIIREKEPPLMSTRLSTMGEQATSVADRRATDTLQLSRLMRGDLDWIVHKALQKDRTKRYESASEFAADVQRHLNHEPVLAKSPRLREKVSKFVQRNRPAVAAGAVVTTAVLLGTLASAAGFVRARSDRDRVARMADFLQQAMTVDDVSALGAPGAVLSEARQLFGDNHAVVGGVLLQLGDRLFDQGDYVAAEDYYRRALQAFTNLGEATPERILASTHLGETLARRQRNAEARQVFGDAIVLGEGLAQPIPAMAQAYEGLARLAEGRQDFQTAGELWNRAIAVYRQTMPDARTPLLEALTERIGALRLAQDEGALEAAWTEVMSLGRQVFPSDSAEMLTLRVEYGTWLRNAGREAEALAELVETDRVARDVPFDVNEIRLVAMNGIFQLLYRGSDTVRDPERAVDVLIDFITQLRAMLGPKTPLFAEQLIASSGVVLEAERYEQAIAFAVEAAAVLLADETVDTERVDGVALVLRRAVGTTLMDEALTDAEVSAAVSGAEQLVDWVPRADSRLMLVTALTRAGRLDEAVAVAEQAEAENAGEPRLATVLAGKAWALQLQGDVFGAQAAYRAALAARDDAQSELMLFDTRLFDRVREKLNVPEADAAAPPGTE